ncbi:MAG: CcmD family protein [Coriobacteriia bacterium]|nr:CcmD family protein [Coriobacteriia bacterium]
MIDPTNTELYDLVLQDAPFVIAAYGILWLGLCAYVTFMLTRMLKMGKELTLLEDAVDKLK